MRKTKSIRKLLVLMKDNVELVNPLHPPCGLCGVAASLLERRKINRTEYNLLKNFIYAHHPKKGDKFYEEGHHPYFWVRGEWKIRKAWLTEKIKRIKK